MARIYVSDIPDRLIIHENNDAPGNHLVLDMEDDWVAIYQYSDDLITAKQLDVVEEGVTLKIDDAISIFQTAASMLENWRDSK